MSVLMPSRGLALICRCFFYNSSGAEEISASGTSYLNRTEAANIEKLVTYLLKAGLRASQIGVITPYEGQRAYISALFQRQTMMSAPAYQDIEIASVDAFQGREKDFILLSCVRSNQNQGIGFLNDPRRLNVALTRARLGLVICGNAKVLGKQFRQQPSLWCNLLCHFKKYNLVVEGPLSNLNQLHITLQRPTRLPTRYNARGITADTGDYDADYVRGGPQWAPGAPQGYGMMEAPSSSMAMGPLHAPPRYFPQPIGTSGGYSGRERTDRKKRQRAQPTSGSGSQNATQNFSANMMSQESFTAFDEPSFSSQDPGFSGSHSFNPQTQDL